MIEVLAFLILAGSLAGTVYRIQLSNKRLVEVSDRSIAWQREALRLETAHRVTLAAVARHRNAKGHDSCWLNDSKLYAACGLEPARRDLPAMPEFLFNCARYYQEQVEAGGGARTTLVALAPCLPPSGEPDCASTCPRPCPPAAADGPPAGQGRE